MAAKLPFNFEAVLHKQYSVLPVPRNFILSTHTPKPQILWVGCSDSLICETETLDVLSKELFVHRNLGNILSNGDLSSESAVEWGVELLKVDHIVVCGHYDCALIKEPSDPTAVHGWYKDITKLHTLNETYFAHLSPQERDHHFEEVYVLAEVEWLKQQPIVKQAMQERGLRVHAFVYERERRRCVRLVETALVNADNEGERGGKVVNEKVGECGNVVQISVR